MWIYSLNYFSHFSKHKISSFNPLNSEFYEAINPIKINFVMMFEYSQEASHIENKRWILIYSFYILSLFINTFIQESIVTDSFIIFFSFYVILRTSTTSFIVLVTDWGNVCRLTPDFFKKNNCEIVECFM